MQDTFMLICPYCQFYCRALAEHLGNKCPFCNYEATIFIQEPEEISVVLESIARKRFGNVKIISKKDFAKLKKVNRLRAIKAHLKEPDENDRKQS